MTFSGLRKPKDTMKMFSYGKAGREDFYTNAIADTLGRVIIAFWFRLPCEFQIGSAQKLLMNLLFSRGEKGLTSYIVTADMRYSNERFMNLTTEFGFASVFFIPENLLRWHLFMGVSFLNLRRQDGEKAAAADKILGESVIVNSNLYENDVQNK